MSKFIAFILLVFSVIIYQAIIFFDPFIKAIFVGGVNLIGFAASILSVAFVVITILRVKVELIAGKFKEALYALLLGLFLASWMAVIAYKIIKH